MKFDKLDQTIKDFSMIEKLWKSREEWKIQQQLFSQQHFLNIDIDELQKSLDKLSKNANYCMKELEFNEVAKELKQEIDEFRHIE